MMMLETAIVCLSTVVHLEPDEGHNDRHEDDDEGIADSVSSRAHTGVLLYVEEHPDASSRE